MDLCLKIETVYLLKRNLIFYCSVVKTLLSLNIFIRRKIHAHEPDFFYCAGAGELTV